MESLCYHNNRMRRYIREIIIIIIINPIYLIFNIFKNLPSTSPTETRYLKLSLFHGTLKIKSIQIISQLLSF